MKKKVKERLRAVALRKKGYSVNEITETLKVAKGSVSAWVRNVELSSQARKRLLTRVTLGQIMAAEKKRKKTNDRITQLRFEALKDIKQKRLSTIDKRILCALIYFCEGDKSVYSGVTFTNSDPGLIRTFLQLFRESFSLDESKFRAQLHVHKYHDPSKQIRFWSQVTDIPHSSFTKPYQKPHTGRRIRENYPGCLRVKYYDNDMARRLQSYAHVFIEHNGSIG